jgi:hypothetical protein
MAFYSSNHMKILIFSGSFDLQILLNRVLAFPLDRRS